MNRLRLRVNGMHCTACAMSIDMELEELPGVQRATTHFARSTTEVVFDPSRANLKTILQAVRQAGYTAEPVA